MFTLAEITNRFLNVKPSIGEDSFIARRIGTLEANSGEVFVYDNQANAVTLDYLEFATNSPDKIRFRIYHGSTRLAAMRSDGITVDEFTLERVINSSIGFFDILEYNPSVNLYKVRFNIKEFKCPKGLRISVINDSTDTAYRAGVYGFGRVM